MGSVTAKLALLLPFVLGLWGISTPTADKARPAAVVAPILADRDMDTSNGYCRPSSNGSLFVNRASSYSSHTALVFDTSAIPAGAVVTAAHLQLHPANTMSHAARIYAVPSVDLSLTYNCIPTTFSSVPVAWHIPALGSPLSVDVSPLLANVGHTLNIVITPGDDLTNPSGKGFWSMERDGGVYAPRLVIEYAMSKDEETLPVPPPAE